MTEERRLRVGVLGVGSIAQVVHLPILSGLPEAELTAVADADQGKARAIAARFGIPRVYASDEEMLRADDIDAVVICTPNHLHEEQAIGALQAGKHTLVEKPLAMTSAGATRVLEVAEKAGRTFQVAMNNRFRPDTLALKPFADNGELGHVFLARGAWLNRKMRIVRPTWRHRLATAGGGALMDLGVQALDLAFWLLGSPKFASVFAHAHHPAGLEVEDSAAVLVRLAGGAGVSLTVSWSLVAGRDRHYLRLLGTRGSGAIAPLAVFKELDNGIADVTPQLPVNRENLYTVSYRNELQHFLRACAAEVPPPLPHEQVDIMRIVELGYRSAREKREVGADE
jgi:predicted dehydrogenase